MGKDKSILEKITGTMKDIANIAADAADRRRSRSAKEACRLEASRKGKQEDSSKKDRQKIHREADEESYSAAVTKGSPGIREENQQENEPVGRL
jgi:hypothetical protein